MSRFNETELAMIERLRVLKALPKKTINLSDVADPMKASGFSQRDILEVLTALEQDGILAFAPGNRLRMTKPLPE